MAKFQLTNIGEMMNLKNHSFDNRRSYNWGKSQQWMLKLIGRNTMRNRTSPQVTNDSRETW